MVNSLLLLGTIKNSGKTQGYLAKKLGVCRQTLANKVAEKTKFKNSEIVVLCNELGITDHEDVRRLFFANESDIMAAADDFREMNQDKLFFLR